MTKKNTDETLDTVAPEQVADESLGDVPAPEPETRPEEFDFSEWLSGLAPLTARYRLVGDGPEFVLQARTRDWLREQGLILDDGAEVPEDHSLRFLAAHIVKPEGITVEALEKIGDTPGYTQDVVKMATLAMNLSYNPGVISAYFLRGASD